LLRGRRPARAKLIGAGTGLCASIGSAIDERMTDPALHNEDLAPTPGEKRTWNLWHIAALWVGMAVCIPTYTLASGLVAEGWSWQAAVLSVALGNVVVLVPMILNAHAGTRYGVPFPVFLRSSFGVFGANIPALLRAFVACGWFGIQTYIGGTAISTMIRVLGGLEMGERLPGLGIEPLELFGFLIFWVIQVVIILRGMDSIKMLEAWSAPFLLAIGVALLGWAWVSVENTSDLFKNPENAKVGVGAVLGVGLTGAVSFWGTLALNIPDFARFAKSQRDQAIGQAIGLPTTMAFFAFIGAVVTNATVVVFATRISDPVQLLGKIGGPLVTIVAMFALLIATLSTNLAANIVGPANDFSNAVPSKINFKKGAIIASIVGVIIMPWRLYNDAAAYLFTWLLGYGAMLGAVGGIMITDYFLIRDKKLVVDDLYRRDGIYQYKNGFNPVAIVALLAGILPNVPGFIYKLTSADKVPNFELPAMFATIYDYAWFVAFFIASAVHFIGMKVTSKA
jgi:nucleobase:cation symporter-1, NCS1 family